MAMKRPGIYAPLSAYYFDDTATAEAAEHARDHHETTCTNGEHQ